MKYVSLLDTAIVKIKDKVVIKNDRMREYLRPVTFQSIKGIARIYPIASNNTGI